LPVDNRSLKKLLMNDSQPLFLYVSEITARVEYAFSLLFEYTMRLPYELTDDLEAFRRLEAPKLHYHPEFISGAGEWLPAQGLLLEHGISQQFRPMVGTYHGEAVLFPLQAENALLGFDLPGMSFFLASRYEEYQSGYRDAHGRFPAQSSLAFQHGFLEQPLINNWAYKLALLLREKYPALSISMPEYSFRLTIDVDMAWAYRFRPWWLTLGGVARDAKEGKWANIRQRQRVLGGKEADPFYTFDDLKEQAEGLDVAYFFLLGDYGPYDKNINPDNRQLRALIRRLAKLHSVGIHPSYRSNQHEALLSKEIERLAAITGEQPKYSRQHFLMLQLPHTYRRLIAGGITDDFSMGFAEAPGFRAGMANPFPWYDLEQEAVQPLMIHPFVAMDVTLKQYMGLSPKEGLEKLRQLSDTVKAVGGEFCILWHNSSFSPQHGWAGWREVFEKILSFAPESNRYGT